MKCPICQSKSNTIESRMNENNTRRRRYECIKGHKFRTHEFISKEPVYQEQESFTPSGLSTLSNVWFSHIPSSAQ